MDNKSKLPKPSRLKTPMPIPLTEVKQNVGPSVPKMAVPKRPPQINVAKFNNRRSKSMTNLKMDFAAPSTSTTRTGVKRPAASKIDTDVKPKIVKQPKVVKLQKIPDWDYKSRFQQLNEKHKQLLETHNKLMEDCADSEQMKQNYELTISEQLERVKKLEDDLRKLKINYDDLNIKNVKMAEEARDLIIQNDRLKDALDKKNVHCEELEQLLSKCREEHIVHETLRRRLHNTIQDLKGNIRVFCRVRPAVNDMENEKKKCWFNYPGENNLEIRSSRESISTVGGKPTDTKLEFAFDQVFNEESTQNEFFEELSQLVQSAIDGYNVCVFAYGQTGSGKTYTMQGLEDTEHAGMIPRSVNLIFETIANLRQFNWKYDVKASFLEIYNENIRDLLDPNANQTLDILYNEGRGTTVTNLRIEPISSYKDFNHYMKLAQKHRIVATTDFNEHSSRSHAITKIYLSGENKESKLYYTGSVNLVDLAGSESAKTSKGARLVETKSINKSLSALGSVMLALHNKDKHIPYRNSKLTYLLQSSLGGYSKTLMIVNISPFEDTYAESINSLRFASKVKEVKTKIKRNKTNMNE